MKRKQKHTLAISLTLLIFLCQLTYPQCDYMASAYKEIDFEDYMFNGQENVAWARINEPTTLKTVFYQKNDYKVVIVGDTQNYSFRIRILDRAGNVLWDNIEHNMTREISFTVDKTKSLAIEITPTKTGENASTYSGESENKLQLVEGTCVGVYIGSRPSYLSGFQTRMNEKVAKEKIKKKHGR